MKNVIATWDVQVDTVFGIHGWLEVARVRVPGWLAFYIIATPWFCFSLGEP